MKSCKELVTAAVLLGVSLGSLAPSLARYSFVSASPAIQ